MKSKTKRPRTAGFRVAPDVDALLIEATARGTKVTWAINEALRRFLPAHLGRVK